MGPDLGTNAHVMHRLAILSNARCTSAGAVPWHLDFLRFDSCGQDWGAGVPRVRQAPCCGDGKLTSDIVGYVASFAGQGRPDYRSRNDEKDAIDDGADAYIWRRRIRRLAAHHSDHPDRRVKKKVENRFRSYAAGFLQ